MQDSCSDSFDESDVEPESDSSSGDYMSASDDGSDNSSDGSDDTDSDSTNAVLAWVSGSVW